MLKSVLFDLDGVLVDTYEVWRLLLNDALVHFGHEPVPPERFRQVWGQSLEDDCAVFLPGVTAPDLLDFYNARFPERAGAVALLPGSMEALATCRERGFGTALVTNAPSRIGALVVAATGLDRHLTTVVGGGDVPHAKPAPDMLLEAMRRLGSSANETIMVGDTRYDVDAARAAGVRVVVVGGDADGDFAIDTPGELPGLLATLT